jgi:hypothetical protein
VSSAMHSVPGQVPSMCRHGGEGRLHHHGQLDASEFLKASYCVHKPQTHGKGQLDPTRGAASY